MVVDANLSLVLEVVSHSCEVRGAKGVGEGQLSSMPVTVVCQFPDEIGSSLCKVFKKWTAREERVKLTLVVDANVDTLFTRTEHVRTVGNGGETSGRDSLSVQLVNLSLIPAFALREAKLLDSVVGIKVVHADLPTFRQVVSRKYSKGLLTSFPAL